MRLIHLMRCPHRPEVISAGVFATFRSAANGGAQEGILLTVHQSLEGNLAAHAEL